MKKSFILTINELDKICEILPKSGVLLLVGNLASGKTTLVKSIAKALHVKSQISSPTFSVMNEYEGKIYHYDIYQNGTAGFLQQGLMENLMHEGLHVIEWADESFEKMLTNIGLEYTKVSISILEDKRLYEVEHICTN